MLVVVQRERCYRICVVGHMFRHDEHRITRRSNRDSAVRRGNVETCEETNGIAELVTYRLGSTIGPLKANRSIKNRPL